MTELDTLYSEFYRPLLSREETLAKLGALKEKPADTVTDKELLEAIADTFATIGREGFEKGAPDEYGQPPVDWDEIDEVYEETPNGEIYISFYREPGVEQTAYLAFPDHTIRFTQKVGSDSVATTRRERDEESTPPHTLTEEEKREIVETLIEMLEATTATS